MLIHAAAPHALRSRGSSYSSSRRLSDAATRRWEPLPSSAFLTSPGQLMTRQKRGECETAHALVAPIQQSRGDGTDTRA